MAVAQPTTDGRAVRAPAPAAAGWLLAALTACVVFAAFADGATDAPQEAWLQLGLAATGTFAAAGWLFGNGLRPAASRAGWMGLALLAAFAVWTTVTVVFSVTPDRSWASANRAIAFALALWCALVLGTSLPRAITRVGLAIAFAALPVALFALAGKTLPGVSIGPVDFDQAVTPSRLSAPLGYWNALALLCAFGALPFLRVACDPWRRASARTGALAGTMVFVVVAGLTTSADGLVALVVGALVLVAAGTQRLRTVVAAVMTTIAAAVPIGLALGSDALSMDGVPLDDRTGPALQVLLATVVAAGVLAAVWRAVIGLEARGTLHPERGRAVGRRLVVLGAGVAVAGVVALVATGVVGDAVTSFKAPPAAALAGDPGGSVTSESEYRWTWWREAAGGWSEKPVAGWGAGSFSVTNLLYRRQPVTVQQPHAMPLQWLTETGLVGLLLVGAGLAALGTAVVARVRSLPGGLAEPDPERGAAAVLLAIGAAWAVHALVDWTWDIPAVTLPALLALGVLAARPGSRVRPVSAAGPAFAGVLVAVLAFAVSAVLPAYAQTRVNTALATAAREEGPTPEQLEDAASAAALAAKLNPLSDDGLYAGAIVAERAGRLDDARTLLLRAVDRQPSSVQAWVELARVDFQRQDRDALRREAQRALLLDPVGPTTIDVATRAQQAAVLPYESATATGTPLATQVQTGPVPVPEPEPAPTPPTARPPRTPELPDFPTTVPGIPTVPPTTSPTPSPSTSPTPTATPGPGGKLPPSRTSGDEPPAPEP